MGIKHFTKIGRTVEVVLDKKVKLFEFVTFTKKALDSYFREKDPREGVTCRKAHKIFGIKIRENLDYVIEWGNTTNSFIVSGDPEKKSDKYYILGFDAQDLQIEQLTGALAEASRK